MQLMYTIRGIASVGKNECSRNVPKTGLTMAAHGPTWSRGLNLTVRRECVGIYHTLLTLLCRKQACRVLKTIMQSKVDQWAAICVRSVGHNHAGILPLPGPPGEEDREKDEEKQWHLTKVADLKFSPTRASVVSADAQKSLKNKKAKGLRLQFHQLMIPQLLTLRVVGEWGNAGLPLSPSYYLVTQQEERSVKSQQEQLKERSDWRPCVLAVCPRARSLELTLTYMTLGFITFTHTHKSFICNDKGIYF
jgi:hypothetical protein